MSVAVTLDELEGRLAFHPWGYLVTVADDLRARLLAVPTVFAEGTLRMDAGPRTRANAVARPAVTMVFPPVDAGGYSLIVDGTAAVDGEELVVTAESAVLHRPALPEA